MATYAIGDIQGCHQPLLRLLESFNFDPPRDTLWFVGDLVNRGPDSLETLRFVRQLGERAVCVLGNHDLHLLAVATGHTKLRKDDTLSDILGASDRDELIDWLRRRPLMHLGDGYAMVHAGLLPQWSIEHALRLAQEVEQVLRGRDYGDFLTQMYGNDPDHWSDSLSGFARLRVIVNAMTRMRVCSIDGRMDLEFKGEPQNAPRDRLPWYEVPAQTARNATVIFGHWSALGLLLQHDVVGLDSGCLWGRQLSALRLEDRCVFQVSCGAEPATKREP